MLTWKRHLGLGCLLAVAWGIAPPETAKLVVWPLVASSSVIAIAVGLRRHRPRVPAAWYLIGAGVLLFGVGDFLYSYRNYVVQTEALFPSFVDVIYLTMYPLLIAGLILMVRHRTSGKDRATLIDATIITSGLGLVVWVVLIAPYVRSDDLGIVERLVSIAYPLGDVALLAIAVRLAVGGGRRPTAFWLLVSGLVALLVADSLYGYLNLTESWHEHHVIELGWIVFYVFWGAAALHPSMTELTVNAAAVRRVSGRRLVFMGVGVLVPPAILFIEQAGGSVTDGAAIAVLGTLSLVLVMIRTAGLASDAANERNEARFRALIENASDAVVVLDGEGVVQYFTRSTEQALGHDLSELGSQPFGRLLHRSDAKQLELILAGLTTDMTAEWRVRLDDGVWRDIEVVAADLRGHPEIDGLVLTMRDITERKAFDSQLREQALHDALTLLPNRTLFLDRVGHALDRVRRTNESIAVLFIDLDDFKMVNDGRGHSAGDELLIAVAARLLAQLRPGDTVARFGGDEFTLLVENGDVAKVALRLSERIQRAFEQPFSIGTEVIPVRASIGVAIGSPSTYTPDSMLRDADVAMYVAKRKGKGRTELFEPAMHEEARRRLELVGELRVALERSEFVVHYQPIVDVRAGAIKGVEALVRWQHPTRGVVAPSDFIPVAETNGLIVALGRWVLKEACAQAQQWKTGGLVDDSFYVSVNLSARHVQDPDIVQHVTAALDESGLSPSCLVLEVTETALMENVEDVITTLRGLKKLGVQLAIDDFGTGYSSLAYLSSFPVDLVKIDKSFIDQIAVSLEGEAMVRAVVELARTLGLRAIAEGIEQREQADALEHLGCMLGQGFLFARPSPADQLTAALAGHVPVPTVI